MVDKRSLRSSKKDTQDTPAEDDQTKPTRTRSTRSRKAPSKKNEEQPSTTTSSTPPFSSTSQSEDVVMETDTPIAPEQAPKEDIEMKNADAQGGETKKEDAREDPAASTLASTFPSFMFLLLQFTNLLYSY